MRSITCCGRRPRAAARECGTGLGPEAGAGEVATPTAAVGGAHKADQCMTRLDRAWRSCLVRWCGAARSSDLLRLHLARLHA